MMGCRDELWTPNPRTVAPLPICLRCGGMDRHKLKLDHRDARRYLSLHRICCCCRKTIQITLSGVDADSFQCSTCQTISGGGDVKVTDISINGTYSIDITNKTGTACSYLETNATAGSQWAQIKEYAKPGNCASLIQTITSNSAEILVELDTTSVTIKKVRVRSRDTTPELSAFFWDGSSAMPATVGNTIECGGSWGNQIRISDAGTASVIFP